MDNIIPFPRRDNDDEVSYYSFSIEMENYLLVYFENKNEISYARSEFTEDGDIQPVTITTEEVQILHEKTFPTFFLNVTNENDKTENERYIALLYFQFESAQYALYYHELYEDLPLLVFRIEDNKVHKIDNPFQVRKVVHYVEETFDIEWL